MAPAAPPSPVPSRWRWPALRLRPALQLLAGFTGVGLLMGNAAWLAMQADGSDTPWSRPYLWELTGALSAWVLLPLPLAAVLNAPSPRHGGWRRFLAVHGGAFLLFAALHTPLMVGSRQLLYELLGWGNYTHGPRALRVPMEWQKDVFSYLVLAAAFSLLRTWRESQQRALREAQLESELRSAQLRALSGQLDPHFLFNALNTLGAVMYEDLGRAERLLSDLGRVLRAGLEQGPTPLWGLAQERAHTERYVALLLARFGDRLQVTWELAPGLEEATVPRFALQLLVENAVKHNQDRTGPLRVRIGARRVAGALQLEVEDDGRGFSAASQVSEGVGLSTLRRVLALAYGPEARVEAGVGSLGGAQVRLLLPEPSGAPAGERAG